MRVYLSGFDDCQLEAMEYLKVVDTMERRLKMLYVFITVLLQVEWLGDVGRPVSSLEVCNLTCNMIIPLASAGSR